MFLDQEDTLIMIIKTVEANAAMAVYSTTILKFKLFSK